MSEKHTPESNEALRQLRQVIPFRVALECKHQEPVGNLRVILESAERAAEEVDHLLSTLRTQHALLQQAREALNGINNIVRDSRGVAGYHLNGDTAEWDDFDEVDAADTALAALNQHLDQP